MVSVLLWAMKVFYPWYFLLSRVGRWSRINSLQRVQGLWLEQVRNSTIVLRQLVALSASIFNFKTLFCVLFFYHLVLAVLYINVCFAGFLRRADGVWRHPKYLWRWRQIRKKKEKTSVKKQWENYRSNLRTNFAYLLTEFTSGCMLTDLPTDLVRSLAEMRARCSTLWNTATNMTWFTRSAKQLSG